MKHSDVYVSLNIAIDDALSSQQRELCQPFELLARPELHLTLGYIGDCLAERILVLGEELRMLRPPNVGSLTVLGVGGAIRDDAGRSQLLRPGDDWTTKPRVLWWAVEPHEDLIGFRNAMIAAVISLGLTSTYLRPTYKPHVTVGSAGPGGQDWSLFDLHDIPKDATLKDIAYPPTLSVERLHITSVAEAPRSIYMVHNYQSDKRS